MTSFELVYSSFFRGITDDMYMSITKEETEQDCFEMLMESIETFEYPKVPLDYTAVKDPLTQEEEYFFLVELTGEERLILAIGMRRVWLERQIMSIEATRQRYTGADFKQTSQASHLHRLLQLADRADVKYRGAQMAYSRRQKNKDGIYESTMGQLTSK